MKKKYGKRKILEGRVVSDKMDKTIVVTVLTKSPHTVYKKQLIKRKKYKVHDEKNQAKLGDQVRAIASRRLSKDKRFRLVEVLDKA